VTSSAAELRNGGAPAPRRINAVVTSLSSDAHTWNLVFLQLFLEERGINVRNLGPCVPAAEIVEACLRTRTDLLVVSTVNGHGAADAEEAIILVRAENRLSDLRVVIGGKLGTEGYEGENRGSRLLACGYDAVFEDADLNPFELMLGSIAAGNNGIR
jgi:methylaspartate mutase sigma subunit